MPGIIFDIWLDAQHLYMVIAQRAVELPALHAVAATAIAATAATRRTRTRPTLRRVQTHDMLYTMSLDILYTPARA